MNRKNEVMAHESKGGRWLSTERDGLHPISETLKVSIQDTYVGNGFWEDEHFQRGSKAVVSLEVYTYSFRWGISMGQETLVCLIV